MMNPFAVLVEGGKVTVTSLIRKDMMVLLHPSSWIIILLFAIFFGAVFRDVFTGAFLISLVMVFSILSVEIKYKTDPFITSLPTRRVDIVISKYMMGIILSIVGYLLTFIFALPYIFTQYSFPVTHIEPFATISLELVILAIFYPFHYKFGGVLSWIFYLAALGGIVGGVSGNESIDSLTDQVLSWMPAWMLLICVILLYVLSCLVSILIYKNKES